MTKEQKYYLIGLIQGYIGILVGTLMMIFGGIK